MLGDWEHQTDGIRFGSGQKNVYLNWGMGSGKTRAAISIARDSNVVVIVCPISVAPAWVRAFAECDPSRRVISAYSGSSAIRAKRIAAAGPGRVAVIINYDSVWRRGLADSIEKLAIDHIILDEAHRAKSPGGRAARYLYRLAIKHRDARRLCLSGTPCPHSPMDLYAQYRFLDASVFGTSFATFRARYAIPHPMFASANVGYRNQSELAAKIQPTQHTVDTDAVLTLPDAIHTRIDVPLTRDESNFYLSMAATLVAQVGGGEVSATNVLTQLLRLQQACSGHTTVDGENVRLNGATNATSKGAALADWMADLPASSPLVVFCRFREDLAQVHLAAIANKRESLELSGTVNELAEWQGGAGTVLAVQIASGGVGIDLTRASHCAFLSLGFSLGEFEQALARIRRPGARSTCRYYHFLASIDATSATVDDLVYRALRDRRAVIDTVLDGVKLATGDGNASRFFAKERSDCGFNATAGGKKRTNNSSRVDRSAG